MSAEFSFLVTEGDLRNGWRASDHDKSHVSRPINGVLMVMERMRTYREPVKIKKTTEHPRDPGIQALEPKPVDESVFPGEGSTLESSRAIRDALSLDDGRLDLGKVAVQLDALEATDGFSAEHRDVLEKATEGLFGVLAVVDFEPQGVDQPA